MYKHIFLSFLILFSSTLGWTQEVYLDIEKHAQEVLQPKAQGLNLSQIKKIVVEDQLDLKIAYERVFQAQRKISLARAQYFPYGAGSVAMMYLVNVWNPLFMIELITSLPSKWYHVQSEKYLRQYEEYNYEALRENLKTQIAHLYYGILKEEAALKIVQLEIQLMEKLLVIYEQRLELGLSEEVDVQKMRLRLWDLKDIALKFSAYLIAEKAAFNYMITQSPEESSMIALQPVSTFLNSNEFDMSLETMVATAVYRSPEIKAADQMIYALSKAKKSTRWSILSFSGIGFGYLGRLQVAGSKIEGARLDRQLVEDNIANEVYVLDAKFKRSMKHFESEVSVLKDTEFFVRSTLAQYHAGEIPLDHLLEAQLLYLSDYKEMVLSHYDALIAREGIDRVLLGQAIKPSFDKENISVQLNKKRRYSWISLSSPEMNKIAEVTYSFKEKSLYDMTSQHASSGFSVGIRTYNFDEPFEFTAKIVLRSGEVLSRNFII
jgi:hypothetical protein